MGMLCRYRNGGFCCANAKATQKITLAAANDERYRFIGLSSAPSFLCPPGGQVTKRLAQRLLRCNECTASGSRSYFHTRQFSAALLGLTSRREDSYSTRQPGSHHATEVVGPSIGLGNQTHPG